MRRMLSKNWVGRLAHVVAPIGVALVVTAGVASDDVRAAEEAKPADEAQAIESRLIDLQVQAGVLKSLQTNALPVDTGVLAERQTTSVMPGRQDPGRIAQIDDEIRRLSTRYRKLTGRGAGIVPGGIEARQPAAGAMIAQGTQPVTAPAAVPSPTADATSGAPGGWSGTTTVSPSHGGQFTGGGGGWGGQTETSPWQQPGTAAAGMAGAGQAPGLAGAAPYGANGQAGGAGVPAQGSLGGWGDTSGGRVGEVLPPGVPYPGTENGQHDQALASLDQARRQGAPPSSAGQPAAGGIGGGQLDGADAAYEQAYSYMLEQDYGAAEFAFGEFLTRYPGSPLAGNAQYWLGEINYVQGKYKEAARAFLTGYEKYGDGNKAAESLFKLALSLDKLNQPQAACSSLSEFFKRYGSTGEVPAEQVSEVRQRLRCRS